MFRVVLLHRVIRLGVVLVVVDLLAGVVLLMVDLCAVLRCELAAVGCAIAAYFVVDLGFAIFKMTGLARSQLPYFTPFAMRSCWLASRVLTRLIAAVAGLP